MRPGSKGAIQKVMRVEGLTQLRSEAVPVPSTVEVLGVALAITGYEQTLDWIDAAIAARSRAYVCTCKVHTLMAAREDPELSAALQGAALVVPAEQPLVWAMSALGHSLSARVSGHELMSRACARAVDSGHRFYLYGGRSQGAVVQLALNLRQRHPGLKIVGGYCPPDRPLADEEQVAIAQEITHARADVVWVGIGDSRQERSMSEMRGRLEAPVLVGVGAAFDLDAGGSRRRQLGYHPKFVGAFARQLASRRRSRQVSGASSAQ